MLVAWPVPLLDPCQVEERLREVVALRPPSGVDGPPGCLRIGKIADAQVPRTERVEHPVGPPFDDGRDQLSAAFDDAGELRRPWPQVVEREDGLDVRRPLERRALAGQQGDRPAAVLALGGQRGAAPAEKVEVRDAGEVHAERRCEAVPEPEAGIDLHELVAAVARVALELHLRDAVEVESTEQSQRGVDVLLHPDRFAHAAGSDAGRRLAELAAAEQPQHGAVGSEVAADCVQLIVAARDQLLHHRLERLGVGVRALELRP